MDAAIMWLMFMAAIPTMLVMAVLGFYKASALFIGLFLRRYE